MQKIRAIFEKLNRRERWLCAMALISALLVGGKFLLLAEIANALESRRESKQLEFEIAQIEQSIQGIKSTKREDLRKDPMWRYLKENKGVAGLVKVVSAQESTRKDFSLRKIASEKFEKGADFDKTTLQIEVETPFNSLGSFLEDLENSDLLTRVESVRVERTEKELKLCRATIQLNSYYWRDL